MKKCSICGENTHLLKDEAMDVQYHVCDTCQFVEKDKQHFLSFEQEEKEYLRHNNTMENTGYVSMFESIIQSYVEPLQIEGMILDYGSGPVPVFKELLLQHGYEVNHFDPFYHKDESYHNQTYSLITLIEVMEHFFHPMDELHHLLGLLEDNGYLLIKTNHRTMDETAFLNWWYRRDVAHVGFYNQTVFKWIMNRFDLELVEQNEKDIIILKKGKLTT